jgi:HAD superfamily hydrolase (TIGR01549 family)
MSTARYDRSSAAERGLLISVSGLSGSGKSTLATALVRRLREAGWPVVHLDRTADHEANASTLRSVGWADPDPVPMPESVPEFDEARYRAHNEYICSRARSIVESGVITILSFISPYRAMRDSLRDALGDDRYVEIYVNTPLSVCEARDPKRLYERVRRGATAFMPGVNSPYEPPASPLLTVSDEAVRTICRRLGLCDAPTSSWSAVVVDLFGTLVEPPPLERRLSSVRRFGLSVEDPLGQLVAAGGVLAPLFEALGVPFTRGRDLAQTRSFESVAALADTLAIETGRPVPAQLVALCERELERWRSGYRLAEGAVELLAMLNAAEIPVAILSNADSFSKIVATELGLVARTSAALFSCDLGVRKPDRAAFVAAMARLAAGPAETLVVGDSWQSDIVGALAVGASAVWVNGEGRAMPRGLTPSLERSVLPIPRLSSFVRLFSQVADQAM